MLQMDFMFFNVESIRGFTSTFVAICSATSYPFGFPSRSKIPPLDILKFLFTSLRNQDKTVAFIRVDEYRALARSSEFMKTCHNMSIIFQTTGGDTSFINGKRKIPNKTLANITRDLLMNSSHKKELLCFPYQYVIRLSRRIANRLHGVTYFLWYGTIPSYYHIKIWYLRVYITNERVTREKIHDRSHCGYFMGYVAITVVII